MVMHVFHVFDSPSYIPKVIKLSWKMMGLHFHWLGKSSYHETLKNNFHKRYSECWNSKLNIVTKLAKDHSTPVPFFQDNLSLGAKQFSFKPFGFVLQQLVGNFIGRIHWNRERAIPKLWLKIMTLCCLFLVLRIMFQNVFKKKTLQKNTMPAVSLSHPSTKPGKISHKIS